MFSGGFDKCGSHFVVNILKEFQPISALYTLPQH